MGFMNVHTPIITASDCEGAGEAFSVTASPPTILDANNPSESKAKDVHFFGRPAFLTVSAQLHLEALAQAHNRVYTLGPSFRAEKSQTGRHLAEFWMLEAEWMFTKDIKELCDVVEDLLKLMLACVKRDEGDQDQELGERIEQTFERIGSWQRADYSSVIFLLQRASTKFEFTPTMESGLQSEHEKWLAEHFGGPVFIRFYYLRLYIASKVTFYPPTSASRCTLGHWVVQKQRSQASQNQVQTHHAVHLQTSSAPYTTHTLPSQIAHASSSIRLNDRVSPRAGTRRRAHLYLVLAGRSIRLCHWWEKYRACRMVSELGGSE